MAKTITLTFTKPVNKSLQIGDTVYYATITNNVTGTPVEIGTVVGVTSEDDGSGSTVNQVTFTLVSGTTAPNNTYYYFFSKDNKANLSSLVGYYAEVEMKNESTSEVELYQVGSQISESSK
tara:strand:- start:2661 stop:3023 length:363 start_codon:yes stop_codon:yes gene_type:complete